MGFNMLGALDMCLFGHVELRFHLDPRREIRSERGVRTASLAQLRDMRIKCRERRWWHGLFACKAHVFVVGMVLDTFKDCGGIFQQAKRFSNRVKFFLYVAQAGVDRLESTLQVVEARRKSFPALLRSFPCFMQYIERCSPSNSLRGSIVTAFLACVDSFS